MMDAIARAMQDAYSQWQQYMNGVSSAYGGAGSELKALGSQYGPEAGRISDLVMDRLGGLSGELGVPLPSGELYAGGQMYGALGGGALSMIGSAEQRAQQASESALREAGLAQQAVTGNLTQNYMDTIGDLMQQRLDIIGGWGPQIRQRKDELKQQRLENMLVQQKLAEGEAMQDYVASLIGEDVEDGRSRDGREEGVETDVPLDETPIERQGAPGNVSPFEWVTGQGNLGSVAQPVQRNIRRMARLASQASPQEDTARSLLALVQNIGSQVWGFLPSFLREGASQGLDWDKILPALENALKNGSWGGAGADLLNDIFGHAESWLP